MHLRAAVGSQFEYVCMFSDQTPGFDQQTENKNYGFLQEPIVTETINMVLLTQFVHPTKKWLISIHHDDEINLWEINLAPPSN